MIFICVIRIILRATMIHYINVLLHKRETAIEIFIIKLKSCLSY